MAADNEEENSEGLEEPKSRYKSDSDLQSSRLFQKAPLLAPFASPLGKRPLTPSHQEENKRSRKKTKYDNDDPRNTKERNKEKRDLLQALKKKEEILRKLNLVKMYRAKNNLSDLGELICKWRSISQTAAQDLFDKFYKDKDITMGQFLDGMRVSHDLIKYSVEEETFY